ncbi:Type II secretory pathway component [Pseudomonas fluorescens]|uniref:Type II secretory pathway component n=1 Tax=Pseudomonas fluorescens TaxID=294 RepID=UPI001CD32044|nr:Type II secretory pathway component [Pseudomonas fluorescens]
MFKTLIVSVLLCSAIAQGAIAQDASAAPLDPTQPPANRAPTSAAVPGEQVRPLVLQEILSSPRGSRAVIDGQTLRVGQSHAGARVMTIDPQTVLIERHGKREYLRLAKPVLQPSR